MKDQNEYNDFPEGNPDSERAELPEGALENLRS